MCFFFNWVLMGVCFFNHPCLRFRPFLDLSLSSVVSWLRKRQDHVQNGAALQSSFKEHLQKRSFEVRNRARNLPNRRQLGTDVAQNMNRRWKSETLRWHRVCIFWLRYASLIVIQGELPLPASLLVLVLSHPHPCGGHKRQHHPHHQGSRRGDAQQIEKIQAWFNMIHAISRYISIQLYIILYTCINSMNRSICASMYVLSYSSIHYSYVHTKV